VGILYSAATLPALKRNHIIERLLEKGIKETKDGTSIHDLSYRELKLQLSIAQCLEVEVEKDDNRWF
jgi:hypothetical protein